MNCFYRDIIALIRSGLSGEAFSLSSELDLEKVYTEATRHKIVSLVYEGAINCGVNKNLPAMRKMFLLSCQFLTHGEKQWNTIEQLFHAFDKNAIEYMPLKGSSIRPVYPQPELRAMGDADILIRTEQQDAIRAIVTDLGFTEEQMTDYEWVWNTSTLHLELHTRMVSPANKDFYGYFGDGWSLARPLEGTRYALSPEDEYLYLFVHLAKHYRNGGIGCRHVTDLWVYRQAHPDLKQAYIEKGLKKMHLLEFYQNIEKMLLAWFEDGEWDEKTAFISEFILKSGSWGTSENLARSSDLKKSMETGSVQKMRIKSILHMLFPDMGVMGGLYPIVKKIPVLLPVFWPVRWIDVLLFRRGNIRKQRMRYAATTPDMIQSYQQALNYVGLDFHFND